MRVHSLSLSLSLFTRGAGAGGKATFFSMAPLGTDDFRREGEREGGKEFFLLVSAPGGSLLVACVGVR